MKEATLEHLAIIMDGNRRWAEERGKSGTVGHKAGYERLKDVGDWCLDRGIKYLTVFAFSTENWKRTEKEVGFLMDLFETALTKELESFHKKGVRLKVIGRRDKIRPSVLRAIKSAEEITKDNTKATFTMCFNYGGKFEIIDACKKLIESGISPNDVDEAAIQSNLYFPELPGPELIVRTSGEQRLSGFLLWQSSYSEFYFTNKHWPDFDEEELDKALESYVLRNRRFGK